MLDDESIRLRDEIIRDIRNNNSPVVNEEIFLTALEFVAYHHDGVLRDGGEPYIRHPLRVAANLSKMTWTDDAYIHAVVAALAQDAFEDLRVDGSKCSATRLVHAIGLTPFNLVWWLTSPDKSDPRLQDLPREHRKLLQRMKVARAPAAAIVIKLVDRIDNIGTLPTSGRSQEFQGLYFEESLLLADEITRCLHSAMGSDYYVVEGWVDRLRASIWKAKGEG